jgi:aspartate 1-decarboxylase
MRRRFLNSKIHRATVTNANLNYIGSISLDPALLDASGIAENEQVTVVDINNGERFETYVILGGEGEVCLNGAAARLVQPGDLVIILTYADLDDEERKVHEPRIVHVDSLNRVIYDALPA